MHHLPASDNSIHWAGRDAFRTPDAFLFEDPDRPVAVKGFEVGRQLWQYGNLQHICQATTCDKAAGWASIDIRFPSGYGLGVGTTIRITAALALCLRKPRVDGRDVGHLTRIPGSAPSSGDSTQRSLPPGPAAKTIPSDTPNRIMRGARLATITVSLPSSCSGV